MSSGDAPMEDVGGPSDGFKLNPAKKNPAKGKEPEPESAAAPPEEGSASDEESRRRKQRRGRQGNDIASAGPTPLNVLVWNIESFTDTRRPNPRGLTKERVDILCQQMREYQIIVLMETGSDALEIVEIAGDKMDGWSIDMTDVTGSSTDKYGGETYTILYRNNLAVTKELVGAIEAIGVEYRKACLISINNRPRLCVLHAPSPTHALDIRLRVIRECANAARAKCHSGIVFCGDLNIKRDEDGLLEYLQGFEHRGPDGDTTVRCLKAGLSGKSGSQPYDQVWLYQKLATFNVQNVVTYALEPDFKDRDTVVLQATKRINPYATEALDKNYMPGDQSAADPNDINALFNDAQVGLKVIEDLRNQRLIIEVLKNNVAVRKAIKIGEDFLTRASAWLEEGSLKVGQLVVLSPFVWEMNEALQLLNLALMGLGLEDEDYKNLQVRYLISDHKPVRFTLHLPAAGEEGPAPAPAPGAGPMEE
jgi:hypothetical protein